MNDQDHDALAGRQCDDCTYTELGYCVCMPLRWREILLIAGVYGLVIGIVIFALVR